MTPPRSYLDAIRETLLEALECEDETPSDTPASPPLNKPEDRCSARHEGTASGPYPDDEVRRQLRAAGWENRSSRAGRRVRWSWFCPACRPPAGDPGAGGRSVGAGG